MSRPSPDELAKILNLSQDGEVRAIPEEDLVETCTLVKPHLKFMSARKWIDDIRSYVEEFLARYFLSLVRTFVSSDGLSHRTFYMSVIRTFTMEATSFFPRFVRAFPTESCDLYLNIVSMIADPTARLDSEMTLRVEQKLTLVQTHVHLLVLFSTLLDHLPLGIELPILAPNLRQGLRDFAFYCERQVDELDSHFIRAVAEGRNDRIPGFRWAPVVVWEACEGRVGEFAAVLSLDLLGPSTCLKLVEGEEMMACSRCLAVRYCSREHQRADWKRHKKFCFKPTW